MTARKRKAGASVYARVYSIEDLAANARGLLSRTTPRAKTAEQASGKPRYISKLYLANISMVRGKRDEALKMYQDVSKNSSNEVLTQLANQAIKGIEKK